MTEFHECGYPVRISYLIFLIFTILTLMFLWWLCIKSKSPRRRTLLCSAGLVACFALYVILLDDHSKPINATDWQSPMVPVPIALLWIITFTVFVTATVFIIKINRQYQNIVSSKSIKEAFDEVPIAICYFDENGMQLLCNRRMNEISEMMCGKVFMSYFELKQILAERRDWRESTDCYRFPDGRICRYAEDELLTANGVIYKAANFYDITELVFRKVELEAQNRELIMMSAELQRLKENVRLLAKEEEIISIKSKWHDVMGEGLTAIRRALVSHQSQEVTDAALKRWRDAVTTIQRDNDETEQRRDAVGDLMRDAQGLQIQLITDGQLPADKDIRRLFISATRNCLLNAAQHAKATELYARITHTDRAVILSLTNNGECPNSEVVPRGGLVNVLNHAERIGARIEIQSTPCFELKVIVPKRSDKL